MPTEKEYHVGQDFYILSASIRKVLLERKLLLVKVKRTQNNPNDEKLYAKISLDASAVFLNTHT